jgi:nitrogen fixation NifU-like protein
MLSLYQQELQEHFRHPRNCGILECADFATEEYNPSCGDRIAMQGVVVDGILTDIKFKGSGCVISQATASILTEECIGKDIDAVLRMTKDDILSLIGMPLGPTRLKCALLSLQVLHDGLLMYQKRHVSIRS